MGTAIVVPGSGGVAKDGVYRIGSACLGLVREAERLADALSAETVVFSGWSPGDGTPEAEQMRAAWQGADVELVVEPTAAVTAIANSRSTFAPSEIGAAPPSSVPVIVPARTTAKARSTWMLCGVSTTVTSGDAATKRRPSSSIAARVFAARSRSSGLHHSAMAMLPCGAIAAKTRGTS